MRVHRLLTAPSPAGLARTAICGAIASLVFAAGVASASPRTEGRSKNSPASPVTIHLAGAGSTFDAPFFLAAFAAYHELHPSVSVSYAAVGSGMGIERFSADTVNFGASDVPMTAAEQLVARGGRSSRCPSTLAPSC